MNQAFVDYFRCPEQYADMGLSIREMNGGNSGYFRFGTHLCYGGASDVSPASIIDETLHDVLPQVVIEGSTCVLPFDLTDVVTNLRQERYVAAPSTPPVWKTVVQGAYYLARPCLPVAVRRHAQRFWLRGWDRKCFPQWPVDCTVDQLLEQTMALLLQSSGVERVPFIWFWPEGKSSCAIVTHDVEELAGLHFCPTLMDINDSFGIKSSFQLIPAARYKVSTNALDLFRSRGFEVNVHDLKHDGHLFREEQGFAARAERINQYAAAFGSKGFRSGVLYRNLDWYRLFTFSYDMSVPNVGHLDPQPGGCCTVMPFFIGNILELPLTTTQDYSLFHILNSYSTTLWQQQIDIIRQHHGLMSFNIHPDYLNSSQAVSVYKELLKTLVDLRSEADVWVPLPAEVDAWWRQRNAMRVVRDGTHWRIEGPSAERARLAYASLNQKSVSYSVV